MCQADKVAVTISRKAKGDNGKMTTVSRNSRLSRVYLVCSQKRDMLSNPSIITLCGSVKWRMSQHFPSRRPITFDL